jgi:chemotaxis protein CheX
VDVNKINPILEAVAGTLPQLGFQTVVRKAVTLGGSVLDWQGLMINIGMLGSVKGTVAIGMDKEAACRFASTMMMGMEVKELDELSQSAISEMANMVCANACTRFSESGMPGVDISPPILVVGVGGKITLSVPKVISVAFLIDDIPVDIHIGLSD